MVAKNGHGDGIKCKNNCECILVAAPELTKSVIRKETLKGLWNSYITDKILNIHHYWLYQILCAGHTRTLTELVAYGFDFRAALVTFTLSTRFFVYISCQC